MVTAAQVIPSRLVAGAPPRDQQARELYWNLVQMTALTFLPQRQESICSLGSKMLGYLSAFCVEKILTSVEVVAVSVFTLSCWPFMLLYLWVGWYMNAFIWQVKKSGKGEALT